ncbi:hypothetical protein K5I29_07035 [Flavobacterium agricola]|uniref:DUF5683 domain-containing protein n=1 Tax=Flavobacterium agricola TaxID=2870839 RepID=A0ABY6LY41_9FLAO|nr:DUF5683 domain-containing protein [Flavobacterium agricola]UYW00330.1 hypothetical protein K5I29_07035 [Flavobacterium agricola]
MVAQTNNEQPILIIKDSLQVDQPYNALAPAKAAFYSAVLPGLGQAYNKKYWKIPIIYAGMGVSLYFVIDNNKTYNQHRDEYKRRLNGTNDPNDPFYGGISNQRIIDAQRLAQRNRDLSIVITGLIYIINIVDANVDAHLMQFNVNENLSLKPEYKLNQFDNTHNYGLSLNYKF